MTIYEFQILFVASTPLVFGGTKMCLTLLFRFVLVLNVKFKTKSKTKYKKTKHHRCNEPEDIICIHLKQH